MLKLFAIVLGLCLCGAAHAHDIADVLQQSQQQRLLALTPAAPGPRAEAVRRSFEQLRIALGLGPEMELRVVTGLVTAEALLGHVVLANESLADAPESARLFVLAHELGHLVAHDSAAMRRLYQRWIPGEVTADRTDPVATPLGREASALAHQQELAADAYALQGLLQLGWSADDAIMAFTTLGQADTSDSPTHPSTPTRIAHLRKLAGGAMLPVGGASN